MRQERKRVDGIVKEGKERKKTSKLERKGKIKMSVFADDIILYREPPKYSIKNC